MKTFKKILAFVLTFSLVFCTLPPSLGGVENVNAAKSTDVRVTEGVTGGAIYFDESTGTITDCDRSVTSVNIPKTINGIAVTNIGEQAFCSCDSLVSITIPDGVTSIGYDAFYDCSSLTGIIIPEGITRIENNTFENCSGLKSLKIPNSVTYIGAYAFENCSGLVSVKFPNRIDGIGVRAFYGCSGITSITIPEGMTSIENLDLYYFDSLESINVDANNRIFKSNNGILFNKSGDTIICYPKGKTDTLYSIPKGVITIENSAFYFCSNLTNITIPEGVATIGANAFFGCSSLTNISIPKSVTRIENHAFPFSLQAIDVNDNNTSFKSDNGVLFSKLGDTLLYYPGGKADISYIIPEGVTRIGDYAFHESSNLTNITIPEGVTRIEDYAFKGSSNLTNITIPEGVTTIGDGTFFGCSSLTSITIPEGVTTIGDGTFFGCSSLTSLIIPEGVTTIEKHAFSYCSSLTNIKIPRDVNEIGREAFSHCSSLTNIELPEKILCIQMHLFEGCSELTNITIPDGVIYIYDYAFEDCSKLSNVIIPNSVTLIGSYTFKDCYSLKEIYYIGDETGWNNVEVGPLGNSYLTSASICFNTSYEDVQAQKDAKSVDELIAKIGTVTLNSEMTIEAARNAYNKLSAEAKLKVKTITTLENAEKNLKLLQEKDEKAQKEAENVDLLIEKIGTVTLNSKEAIKEARAAYEKLSLDAKKYVNKLATLENAEKTFKTLQEEDEKAQKEAEPVELLITKIGEVTLNSEIAIKEARAAYEKLSPDAKKYVNKLATLEEAEKTFDLLQKADVQAQKDAKPVDEQIAKIGEVTLNSEMAIKEARAAYKKLSPEAKKYVKNFATLEEAEQTLKLLQEADSVDGLIEKLETVTLESKSEIEAVRLAYENLSPEAKKYVKNLAKLEEAEKTLKALQEEEAQKEAGEVDVLISKIGKVTLDSKSSTDAARSAYEKLSPEAKTYVKKLATLEEAEQLLKSMKEAVKIYTKSDLDKVRNDTTGTYMLMNDITFDKSDFEEGGQFYNEAQRWIPIDYFTGTFLGCNHSIKGLKIASFNSQVGLFGYSDGTIRDLNITDCIIMSVGSLSVGAIAGFNGGDIINCNVIHENECFVGAAGDEGTPNMGGIAGINDGNIVNCSNAADVLTRSSGITFMGGIAGFSSNNIEKSANYGVIAADEGVSAQIGGISGAVTGTVSNCYNTGNTLGGPYAGGIIGISGSDIDSAMVSNCYNVGFIGKKAQIAGGVIADSTNTTIRGLIYYDWNIINEGSYIGYGKTKEQMKLKETYVGYDFDEIWYIDSGDTYKYPQLRALKENITIPVAVDNITLNKSSVTINKGDSIILEATVKPDNATDKTVIWETSNPEVASVNGGEVVAISEGTANITCKSVSNPAVSAKCEVTVKDNEPLPPTPGPGGGDNPGGGFPGGGDNPGGGGFPGGGGAGGGGGFPGGGGAGGGGAGGGGGAMPPAASTEINGTVVNGKADVVADNETVNNIIDAAVKDMQSVAEVEVKLEETAETLNVRIDKNTLKDVIDNNLELKFNTPNGVVKFDKESLKELYDSEGYYATISLRKAEADSKLTEQLPGGFEAFDVSIESGDINYIPAEGNKCVISVPLPYTIAYKDIAALCIMENGDIIIVDGRIVTSNSKRMFEFEYEKPVKVIVGLKAEIEKIAEEFAAKKTKVINGVHSTKVKAKSSIRGRRVTITWKKTPGYRMDGYDIYRSTKKYSGYGKKPIFTAKGTKYTNTKGLKAGRRYYYKVRGFRIVDGKKVYSEWSNKTYRTVR